MSELDIEKLRSGSNEQKQEYLRYGTMQSMNKKEILAIAKQQKQFDNFNMGSEQRSSLLSINEIAETEKMSKTARKSITNQMRNDSILLSERHASIPINQSSQKRDVEHFHRINTITLPIDKICENSDTTARNFSPISSSTHELAETHRMHNNHHMQKKYSSVHKVNSFADSAKARPMTGDIKY